MPGISSNDQRGRGAQAWTREESGGVVREDPLQQRDDQFRFLAESSPDLFFRLSQEGEIAYLSPASRTMFGCAPESSNPRHYLTFITSATQPLAEKAFHLLLAGACAQEFVCCMIRPDRLLLRVAVHANPWFDGSQILGVQGRIRELSEQKNDQKRLRSRTSSSLPQLVEAQQVEPHPESLALPQELLRATSAGIGILRRGTFQYVNESLVRLTGYTAAALLGVDWCELFAGTPEGNGSRLPMEAPGVGLSQPVEAQWRRQDGSLVEVLFTKVPFAGKDQSRSLDFLLTVLDITARKQAERELLAAYNALEQVFDVAVPLCLLSLECRLLKVNRAFCDFFGCTSEDVLGKTGQDIWGCESCDTEECPLRLLLGGIVPSYLEIDTMVRDRYLVCTLHAVPYIDAAGQMSGMVITFFDGQERKKIALELLNTQQQLIHAEKFSAIGSLAASIAHEFNNPLCGVRSVVERMARKPGLAPADQGLLKLALEECDRMARLIKGLQQFNLPFTDIRKAFDLHRAIDSVLLLLNKHLKSRKALLHKAYAGGTMTIIGAENQIKQVLLNLLKNCSEALPEQGGAIRIQTRRDRENVHVVLSDTGVGISAEHLPHLFEPFFTTKPAVKEVGLGLSVSYGIIKGHGGDIRVESIPGKGTTFTVILPAGEHCE